MAWTPVAFLHTQGLSYQSISKHHDPAPLCALRGPSCFILIGPTMANPERQPQVVGGSALSSTQRQTNMKGSGPGSRPGTPASG